jgi:hypothetical protein
MSKLRTVSATGGAIVLSLALLAALLMMPAQAAQPGPIAGPTPVSAVVRSAQPEFPVFFSTDVITADTRSDCFEVPDYSAVDLQFLIDQTIVAGAPNTVTLALQHSNDLTTFTTSANVVAANITDTSDLVQMGLFGRHTCVLADVTNTNPVTITAIGVVK